MSVDGVILQLPESESALSITRAALATLLHGIAHHTQPAFPGSLRPARSSDSTSPADCCAAVSRSAGSRCDAGSVRHPAHAARVSRHRPGDAGASCRTGQLDHGRYRCASGKQGLDSSGAAAKASAPFESDHRGRSHAGRVCAQCLRAAAAHALCAGARGAGGVQASAAQVRAVARQH